MEALGNLTGGIAHDFNNLLMAVFGSLELLRKRLPDDPSLLRLVDNAMAGAQRGSSLVQRMLAFARRQELKSEPMDVQQLVDGMTELLRRALGPMITVETRFPDRLPLVETDPNQLESALLNLAVNARDAMNGEGRIVIAARADEIGPDAHLAPGRYVCLSVTDSGAGMDADTLARASEPFFTTKGVGKGSGLGLSMVHGLAAQSGGTLMLSSTPGAGTTAEIWLPALADAAPARAASIPAPPRPLLGTEMRPLTILAVDDDALVLMNTVAMLEDLGHEVAGAHSGAEALALMARRAFDLVVTDHAMPQLTGAQLAAKIRAARPDMPVLLATGYAELPPGEGGEELPRLAKPFTQEELAEAVERVVRTI
jgi:CheY-like chemotaxis protein